MKLAIDSSQSSGSIALAEDGKLLYSSYFDLRVTHSETLMPGIDHALKLSGKHPEALTELFLCVGPGSFTGLRIGLATAKGIAFALKIPVYTFDSLQLAALSCRIANRNILSVIDARMKEVYVALYDPDLRPIIPPRVISPEEIRAWDLKGAIVTGSGAGIVRKLFQDASLSLDFADDFYHIPKADALFSLAELLKPKCYEGDALAELEPFYLRESTAQIKKNQAQK